MVVGSKGSGKEDLCHLLRRKRPEGHSSELESHITECGSQIYISVPWGLQPELGTDSSGSSPRGQTCRKGSKVGKREVRGRGPLPECKVHKVKRLSPPTPTPTPTPTWLSTRNLRAQSTVARDTCLQPSGWPGREAGRWGHDVVYRGLRAKGYTLKGAIPRLLSRRARLEVVAEQPGSASQSAGGGVRGKSREPAPLVKPCRLGQRGGERGGRAFPWLPSCSASRLSTPESGVL